MGHGGLDRTTPASRCCSGCWNDASIPDAIGASYRMQWPCFVPRCIPRLRDPPVASSKQASAPSPRPKPTAHL